MREEVSKPVADLIISHTQTMNILNTSSLGSKDGILASSCLQVLSHLQKHLMTYRKDQTNPA